mgnify:CR=1 FL=1
MARRHPIRIGVVSLVVGTKDEMTAPLIISIVAVTISAFALGWNVYRDLILKPRLKTSLGLAREVGRQGTQATVIFSPNNPPDQSFVVIEGINHGPGPLRCSSIFAFKSTRKDGKKGVTVGQPHLMNEHHLCDTLPKQLAVGEKVTLIIPYGPDCFLTSETWDTVAIKDSYGRLHKVNKKDLKTLRSSYHTHYLKK